MCLACSYEQYQIKSEVEVSMLKRTSIMATIMATALAAEHYFDQPCRWWVVLLVQSSICRTPYPTCPYGQCDGPTIYYANKDILRHRDAIYCNLPTPIPCPAKDGKCSRVSRHAAILFRARKQPYKQHASRADKRSGRL